MDDLVEAAQRVRRGDAAAFRCIVNATNVRLVRLSARILGNVTDAEDVVQEAYVKAFRSLTDGRFDGRSGLETWLYRIVTNTALDALRARGRRPVAADSAPEPAWDGRASAEARLALAELAGWLDALPPDQRGAIVLKAMEGLGSAEIAEILECSEGAVEQRLVRARATLRARRRNAS